jgi:chromosome segregation ATPase
MIEIVMSFIGGFLIASLIALLIISAVHHRAARLTESRLVDSIPRSAGEIQALKDSERAEYAVLVRRLEFRLERLRTEHANDIVALERKSQAVKKLKHQLIEDVKIIDELRHHAKRLRAIIDSVKYEFASKSAALASMAVALAEKDSALRDAQNRITELRFAAESQRIEIEAVNARINLLKTPTCATPLVDSPPLAQSRLQVPISAASEHAA